MAEWYWNSEQACWQLALRRECWYPQKKRHRKWVTQTMMVCVAGRPDVYDVRLLARASRYAAQVEQLEAIARSYLSHRPIKVYGGDSDPKQFCEIVHPAHPLLEIEEIKIPEMSQPERVHVLVDTCYPDPYFFYELIFEDMEVVDAFGGFW